MVAFDFDGVFTDNRVIVSEDGTESVICSRADGFGLSMLRQRGVDMVVISTEQNPVVSARCRKLKLRCVQSCDDKVSALKSETERLGITLEEVAFVGNDINDVECMRSVGFPVAVADAYPEVKIVAAFITKASGGHGAVRELCEMLCAAKTKSGA